MGEENGNVYKNGLGSDDQDQLIVSRNSVRAGAIKPK